jgi:hypothetical protein
MRGFDSADHRTYVDLKVNFLNIVCNLFTVDIELSIEKFTTKNSCQPVYFCSISMLCW